MNDIRDGDRVTWQENGRQWVGRAVRVGVIHTLVKPDGGEATDWILTSKLTRASSIETLSDDYTFLRQAGDLGGVEFL